MVAKAALGGRMDPPSAPHQVPQSTNSRSSDPALTAAAIACREWWLWVMMASAGRLHRPVETAPSTTCRASGTSIFATAKPRSVYYQAQRPRMGAHQRGRGAHPIVVPLEARQRSLTPLPLRCDCDLISAADRHPAVNCAGLRARVKPVGTKGNAVDVSPRYWGPENSVLHQIHHGGCHPSGTR
jgi:hypothetical protein